jgi:hypothetical protein
MRGNSITVTNAAGTALGVGTYLLATNFGHNITSSETYAVTVAGTGLAANMAASIGVTNGGLFFVVASANAPPVASTMTVTASAGLSLKIALTDVATNWSDPNGNTPIGLSGISLTTTNGVTLTTNSSYIFYSDVTGADQISYTITNSIGTTTAGLINIVVSTAGATGQQATIAVSGGTATMSFAGIPGITYYVQRSVDLSTWTTISANTAPGNGVFQFVDNSAPGASAFYRLSTTP